MAGVAGYGIGRKLRRVPGHAGGFCETRSTLVAGQSSAHAIDRGARFSRGEPRAFSVGNSVVSGVTVVVGVPAAVLRDRVSGGSVSRNGSGGRVGASNGGNHVVRGDHGAPVFAEGAFIAGSP